MLTIIKQGQGINVKGYNPGSYLSTSTVYCQTVEELHIAIDHAFERQHDMDKCPSCRAIEGEQRPLPTHP